jgi:hypothetical protein
MFNSEFPAAQHHIQHASSVTYQDGFESFFALEDILKPEYLIKI